MILGNIYDALVVIYTHFAPLFSLCHTLICLFSRTDSCNYPHCFHIYIYIYIYDIAAYLVGMVCISVQFSILMFYSIFSCSTPF